MNTLRRLGQVALIAASALPFAYVAPGIVDAWHTRHESSPSSVTESPVPRIASDHPFAGSAVFGRIAQETE